MTLAVHLGPVRITVVATLFVFMCLNAFRRRPLPVILRAWRVRVASTVWLARFMGRPATVVDPCLDCLAKGTRPPRQVTTVEFGQPTCAECADLRRRERENVLADVAATKSAFPRLLQRKA